LDKENLATNNFICPRYTFAHSQTIYGGLVETRGPYLHYYMNSLFNYPNPD